MRRWLALLALLIGVLGAGAAAACELIESEVRPGETLEQAALRNEREQQASLIGYSHSVFLATPRYDVRRSKTRLTTVAPLLGRKPPKHAMYNGPNVNCGDPDMPRSGQVVVFAGQMSIWDDFWRPWNWGRWVVIGWRYPEVITEPTLAARLRAVERT